MKTKQWKKIGMIISFLALAAIALSGCSSGSDGAAGATGATGPAGPAGADAGNNAAAMSTETMAALNPTITVDSVIIASPPVVKFTVKDAAGNGIKGLGFTSQTATATVPGLANLSFNLAKLVPGAAGAPSKWVSYMVTTVPTKTTAGVAVPSVPTRPTTDTTGTLVDNGNGSYTYTFYRDITKIKDQVAAATFTGDNVLADLGDLTYDPALTHRLVLMLRGNVRGTGTNTADGSNSGVTAVPLENPKVIIYDFVPSTGKAVITTDTQREITTNAACASCHSVTPGHRGSDVRNCVMCHNDQIKYGRPKTTSALAAGTGTAPDATTGLIPGSMGVTGTKTVTTTTTKDPLTDEYTTRTAYAPAGYVIDGETLGNFPIMIHKLHFGALLNTAPGRFNAAGLGPQWRGALLKKSGYGYNLMGALAFQDMREYPLSVMNCKKCHVGDTSAQLAAAPQANNWKTKPSRVGCGSCHDGINWTTGGGTTLGNVKTLGAPYAGHLGGPAKDDSLCIACHADSSIYHITDTSTPLNPETPTDVSGTSATVFRYDISSVTVDAVTGFPTVKFRITQKIGTAAATNVTLNQPAAASAGATVGVDGTGSAAFYLANATSTSGTGGLITGYTGGPNFTLHWSTTGGVDWDNIGSGHTRPWPGLPGSTSNSGVFLADLVTGTGGTLTGPDASGYYTAVLKSANAHTTSAGTGGVTGAIWKAIPAAFPAGAKLRTVQMAGNFSQRNLGTPYTGGLAIPSPSVVKAATGEGRRSVFTMDKCRACHEAGYGNETDGGGHVTPGDFANCVTCHNPMFAVNGVTPSSFGNAYKSTGGISTSYVPATNNAENANFPNGWNFKSLMHNAHLHANKMGNLNRCEMCHLPGTYDSVPANALPTTTKITKSYTVNPVTGLNDTTGSVNLDTDLIVSPYASACLSCHTNADAANHAKVNGALVNQTRSLGGGAKVNGLTTFVSGESCGTCHGVGKSYDVVKIHAAIAGD